MFGLGPAAKVYLALAATNCLKAKASICKGFVTLTELTQCAGQEGWVG
jgi:hypothetical protein